MCAAPFSGLPVPFAAFRWHYTPTLTATRSYLAPQRKGPSSTGSTGSKTTTKTTMAGVSRLKRGPLEKVSEAVSSNVADIDMWAAHTHQVVALLLQIQRTSEEKEKAWAHERAAAAAEALAAARGAKLENALNAGIVAAQGRGVNASFRSWAAVVRSMREAEAEVLHLLTTRHATPPCHAPHRVPRQTSVPRSTSRRGASAQTSGPSGSPAPGGARCSTSTRAYYETPRRRGARCRG